MVLVGPVWKPGRKEDRMGKNEQRRRRMAEYVARVMRQAELDLAALQAQTVRL